MNIRFPRAGAILVILTMCAASVLAAEPATEGRASVGFIPLCDMTNGESYKGENGGLYGNGSNVPPPEHLQAALALAAKIQPLDAQGKPAPDGRIAMITNGMSNTSLASEAFIRLADADARKNPAVLLIDGAQGGSDLIDWVQDKRSRTNQSPWTRLDRKVTMAGATPEQVQVVWVKHAIAMKNNGRMRQFGDFDKYVDAMKQDTAVVLARLKERFPNLKLAYVSSRSYAGYASTPLNPEPYAYESAFAVRQLIQDQIAGDASLSYHEGELPLVLWGPYLWSDGVQGRRGDDVTYVRDDYQADGTHPTEIGQKKIGRQLLHFFTTDPTAKPWFVRPSANE